MISPIWFSPVEGNNVRAASETVAPKLARDYLQNRSQFHILLVDSNESFVAVAGRYLSSIGYAVTTALDHGWAFLLYKSSVRPVNLIITNQRDGGLELIDKVKTGPQDSKVLVCTGDSTADKGRADAVLHKPFDLADLRKAVDNLLGIQQEVA